MTKHMPEHVFYETIKRYTESFFKVRLTVWVQVKVFRTFIFIVFIIQLKWANPLNDRENNQDKTTLFICIPPLKLFCSQSVYLTVTNHTLTRTRNAHVRLHCTHTQINILNIYKSNSSFIHALFQNPHSCALAFIQIHCLNLTPQPSSETTPPQTPSTHNPNVYINIIAPNPKTLTNTCKYKPEF